ncbi:transcriptional regulator NanR [Wenxinia saemankumensis]|uniref:Transcriptional regulator, GntR family n=1 Tax=Wenxinia saemankumensis TaxID=1447782 RepID=A0A1M5ZZ25_9RHOB|nr:transcriptional regulator NanR [Wenxinia saemankumensis]SHI29153.1 transcriptional regulator, GntR family [Wenxinia saemankumensis]
MISQIPPRAGSERITRRKLSDEVFDRLRTMIVTGELAPGDTVPSERDLMERFGVGRPAVREALQTMDTMGLITISHGERSRVNALSPALAVRQVDAVAKILLSADPATLDQLKEARKLIEVGLARIAGERRGPADVADLRALLDRQRSMLDSREQFIRADIAFHRRIAEITGNPLVVAVADAMLTWLFDYHTTLLHWSGNEDVTLSEHARIIDAIESGNPEDCARIMSVHLDRSASLYRHHEDEAATRRVP